MKIYQKIAMVFSAHLNCVLILDTHSEWEDKHAEKIESICKNFLLPYGSGFDSGTVFNFDKSRENRLVFPDRFSPHG